MPPIPAELIVLTLVLVVPEIELHTKEYNINTVEIIGHTDGQANGKVGSNLDQTLESVANNGLPISNLKAGSNADLGLMRRRLRLVVRHRSH